MAFVTYDQLRGVGATVSESHTRLAKSFSSQKNLFLSHSQFDDEKLVRGAVGLLEQHGAQVYVDVFDPTIQRMDAKEQCDHVRQIIQQCNRLVVLFTENTSTSRWIPWELGLADGKHSLVRIATLPTDATDGEKAWGTQQYFSLYPQIRFAKLSGEPAASYAVHDPTDSKYWRLAKWLKL